MGPTQERNKSSERASKIISDLFADEVHRHIKALMRPRLKNSCRSSSRLGKSVRGLKYGGARVPGGAGSPPVTIDRKGFRGTADPDGKNDARAGI